MRDYIRLLTVVVPVLLLPALGWASLDGSFDMLVGWCAALPDVTSSRSMLLAGLAIATFVSEDLACIGAGLLAAQAVISPIAAVSASCLGIFIGDVLLYLTGALLGTTALRHAPLKWFVSERGVDQGKRLFERRGLMLIFLSRFVPGTRTATFLGAGLVRVEPIRLLLVFALAVLIWTPILVLGAMIVGREAVHYIEIYSANALWIFMTTAAGLFLFTRFVVPLFTWRGRRLLLSRLRRLLRWEFWPYYVTNSVTFIYVLYLGCCTYRRPTLFTVVNPAIKPDSGFIGERKSSILAGLPQQALGRWRLVDGTASFEQRCRELECFMTEQHLEYPIVLKPDRGQRGQGVAICREERRAHAWLAKSAGDFIIMEFLAGEEFGVFYYRLPGAAAGVVFSITRKKLLQVEGDGSKTLEELILTDERALCLAPMFLREHASDLHDIVGKGETRSLVDIGTHCRGSLFLDGSELITRELLLAIEEIVRPYEGFYFGRFDLKAPSEADLHAGRNLKVIELNGVTSEATHIYDPANSLWYAWKTLMHQWRIAFEIAACNEKRGHRPMPLSSFLRHWFRVGR